MTEPKRKRTGKETGFLIFCGICLLVFAGLAINVYASLYEAYAAKAWPGAEGKVTHSEVLYHGHGKGCSYDVDFRYEYAVGGHTYAGSRYRFGGGPCTKSAANAIVEGHAAGSAVIVHYDPQNPEESVIEPGALSGNDWLGVYGMPFILALPLWLFARAYRGGIKFRE